jgi:hypothetical protein
LAFGISRLRHFGIRHLPFGIRHSAFAIAFVVLATLNSAGYRYAASDQAFYIPSVLRHLDPALFPRDAALIDAQSHLAIMDEAIAGVLRLTGLSLQHLFLGLYIAALLLLLGAAARVGTHIYRSQWTVAALGIALTLRHAIAKTGANTLEGYFHPRQFAFAIGLWAVAEFLRARDWRWPLLLVIAAAAHPTTALWFGVWLGAAAVIGRPRWRPAIVAVLVSGAVLAAVLVWRGAVADRLVRMDAEWLAAIGEKDLFPLSWPGNVWLTNLVSVPIILMCWRARQRAGLTVSGETAIALGSMALLIVFACWLPFNVARVALAVQLQAARVFWMLDVLATIYIVWWLCERVPQRPRGALVAALLLLLSTARGLYTCYVQFPDRRIFAVDIQHDDWRDAMAFAASTDPASGWLADPIHAARYGSSIRATGRRDVLIEEIKDRAIAMYDRPVAMGVNERLGALSALPWNTPEGARALARRFGLDYLVIDRQLDLPLVHRSGSLCIYRLR